MKIGDDAPEFTLKDGDGNDWSLSGQKGKMVVLLFEEVTNGLSDNPKF